MKTKHICLGLGILFIFIHGLAFGQSQPKKLAVGVMASLSGPAAQWGIGYEHGCSLAVEEINAKGGITVGGEKYQLYLKTYDHAFDPSRSVEIAKRLMMVDKASWIVINGTTVTKPIVPFTEENKTIVMTGGAGTDIAVFQKENYTFKSLVISPEGFFLIWDWVSRKYPNWKTTVEMQPDDASGWDALKDIREKVLPKYGIKLVAETFYKRGTTDFYPILVKFLAAKPDVFDLANMPPADQGRVIKQAREMGYKGPFIAPSASSLAPVLEIAGPAAEGLIYGTTLDPISRFATAGEKNFYDRWVKAYGLPYDYFSLPAGISVYLVAQAMEKSNSLDPDQVVKTLRTAELNVLGRRIRIGGTSVYGPPPRQVMYPLTISVIENGKPKVLDIAELPNDY
jgi:branched-chain amino acid transport system substrate-binding protein